MANHTHKPAKDSLPPPPRTKPTHIHAHKRSHTRPHKFSPPTFPWQPSQSSTPVCLSNYNCLRILTLPLIQDVIVIPTVGSPSIRIRHRRDLRQSSILLRDLQLPLPIRHLRNNPTPQREERPSSRLFQSRGGPTRRLGRATRETSVVGAACSVLLWFSAACVGTNERAAKNIGRVV